MCPHLNASLNIQFKVEFVDTAGIRTSNDEIEQIGIERAKEIAKKADVILLLKEFASDEIAIEDFKGEIITVFTKSDIHPQRQCANDFVNDFVNISQGNFSALERKIHEILTEQMSQMQSVGFSCNERQKSILLLTKSILEKADLSLQAELLS